MKSNVSSNTGTYTIFSYNKYTGPSSFYILKGRYDCLSLFKGHIYQNSMSVVKYNNFIKKKKVKIFHLPSKKKKKKHLTAKIVKTTLADSVNCIHQ